MYHNSSMQEVPIDPPAKTPRLLALDYLRGLFISIIIVDHLWRWPNLFQYVSGRGEMWASAAEGFVIISGLLVGYVHGYKKRNQPLLPLAGKLVRRGLMLYIWAVICTIIFAASVWLFTKSGATVLSTPIERGNWPLLFTRAINLTYIGTWTHFLYLYAYYLIAAPVVIWLLRRRMHIIVLMLSVVGWYIGTIHNIEWLQWQLLFFTAAVIGYDFDILLRRYRRLPRRQRCFVRWAPVALLAVTLPYSLFVTLATAPGHASFPPFGQSPLTLATIALALLWFFGLLSLFQFMAHRLPIWLRRLFLTLGERSLTAYILHIVPLILCDIFTKASDNILMNTFIAALAIHATWGLMQIPHINRVVPR